MKAGKVRSRPVYVETERGTISLVFEADVRDVEDMSRRAARPDVYVIDWDGVRLVRHRDRVVRALLIGVAAYIAIWTISRALHRKS